MSTYGAVLDACVLVPACLRDTLLRLAEEPRLYAPKWSNQILDEVSRTLAGPKFALTADRISYLTTRLEAAFPEALVDGFDCIIPAMQNHEKDRHVLAAAVKSGAQTIVTFNLKHFPEGVLERLGIEAQPPDEFLIHQYHLSPESVTHRLHAQAQRVKRTLPDLLATLARSATGFASMVRDALSIGATTPDMERSGALETVRVKKR